MYWRTALMHHQGTAVAATTTVINDEFDLLGDVFAHLAGGTAEVAAPNDDEYIKVSTRRCFAFSIVIFFGLYWLSLDDAPQ